MSELPEFRVYLSSTIDDMVDERGAARRIISPYGVIKESYRASEEGTIETCSSDVRGAHLYVGLIGHRYGWVPNDPVRNPQAKSITELEYEACRAAGQPPIPRLIFVRTSSKDKWRDSEQPGQAGHEIKDFRQRLGKGQLQQTFQFDSTDQLELALLDAIRTARDNYHKRLSPGGTQLGPEREWARRLKPILLMRLPGSDDAAVNALLRARPLHLSSAALSPAAVDLAQRLDDAVAQSQLCVLTLGAGALQRVTGPAERPHFDRVLQTLQRRGGGGAILGIDLAPTDLPAAWQGLPFVRGDGAALQNQPEVEAARLLAGLQSAVEDPPEVDVRLALPCLVIAPTQAELQALQAADGHGFAAFESAVRKQRQTQFRKLAQSAGKGIAQWPQGCYGPQREDWRCFGPQSPTVLQLIEAVVGAINRAPRGSRERQLMLDARIVPRRYGLDEYLDDVDGSAAMIQSLRDRGALIIVDECALLEPRLRKAAIELLAAPRCAVVTVSPCDPAFLRTDDLLAEGSWLHIGPLVSRFGNNFDPQCELALNSRARLERWLRATLPQLLVEIDGLAPRPWLASRAGQLFGDEPAPTAAGAGAT